MLKLLTYQSRKYYQSSLADVQPTINAYGPSDPLLYMQLLSMLMQFTSV